MCCCIIVKKVGEVKPGDQVDVFIYHDTEDRLTATMKKPLLTLGEIALLEVADFHQRFGCFLEMGLGRNCCCRFASCRSCRSCVRRSATKYLSAWRMTVKGVLSRSSRRKRSCASFASRRRRIGKNRRVDARVYKTLQMGTFVVCDGGVLGFGVIGLIHATERTRLLRLGEAVNVRVAFVREDGNVNCSMREPKEVGRGEDAEKLLAFMRERPNGAMPYSDETPADLISQRFGMSKSAFKRAVGKLMKEGLAYQDGSWTYLKKDESKPVAD